MPHPRQIEFLESRAKRRFIKAGRRGGKTVGVSIAAVEEFLAGGRVLYGAPTAEQTDTFWRNVVQALQPAVDDGVYRKNESERYIELPGTEQRIKAKTAWNADTLRGDYATLLILDEFQLMHEDAWGTVGAPMMLDTNGSAIFVFTPPSIRSASLSKAKDKRHASKMFRRAQEDKTGRWQTFHFTSHENPYLSEVALEELAHDMTSLAYRQEINAEDIDEIPGALWTRASIEDHRTTSHPALVRIVVGVDPKTSVEADSETGIVVCGVDENGDGYVLADRSVDASPEQWGRAVVFAYYDYEADRIVPEVNQGGDMVTMVLRMVDTNVPVKPVHATRGKQTRAEPVAALSEQGRIHFVGEFDELEDQLCSWQPGEKSPDRLDAFVWAMTELIVRKTRRQVEAVMT